MNLLKLLILTDSEDIVNPFWQWIAENPGIVVTALVILATTIFTIFAKVIITIFRFGVSFKSEFVTQKEQREFEKDIENNIRNYKEELVQVTLSAAMEVINEKFKEIKELKETAANMKALEARLNVQVETAMEKVDEVRGMSDNIRALNAKVDRLEYSKDQLGVRRKE